MTMLNLVELQTGLPHASPGPRHAPTGLTAHEHVGFELGWDYAHHHVTPPALYAHEPSSLRNGLLAGQAVFGLRTLAATRHVRKWLQLRLHAWLRGRSVELVQVTPNYLRQIDVSHCPITRVALSSATLEASDASIDRVRNDAGYAAGNLAVMSTKANHAKAAGGFPEALQWIRKIEAERLPGPGGMTTEQTHELHGLTTEQTHELHGLTAAQTHKLHGLTAAQAHELHGLTAAQWARVAVLCSFLEALPHDEACALPLLVLPPNRLRLFNPVQALQAFVSQQLLRPGWSRRISGFEDLLPGKPLKRDFKSFFMALLPRVIEAGLSGGGLHARWAVEDAWRSALVQQRWARFARQLSAAQCEALLASAAAHRLTTTVVVPLCDDAATDGWNLASRGYVPHAPLTDRRQAEAQRQLGW